MNNVFRICATTLDEDNIPNEFTVVMVGKDVKRVISSFLDRFPDADILEINRLNYAGELVFDVI